jgi:hypothetical protein
MACKDEDCKFKRFQMGVIWFCLGALLILAINLLDAFYEIPGW